MRNKFRIICVLFIFLTALAVGAFGQSAANSVRRFDVKFRSGQSQTTRRGAADYAMSYVYRLKVRKGQLITVNVESVEKELAFSVILPNQDTEEDGFKITEWSGKAAQTGAYSLVLVMNNENAKKVPYRLRIKVK